MQTNFFHRGADDGPHPRPQPQYDVPATAGELKKYFPTAMILRRALCALASRAA